LISPRRSRVVAAPAMTSINPDAAIGTSTGAMSSAAGRIRPSAPMISSTPMNLMVPAV
jgi:hypothetical protein